MWLNGVSPLCLGCSSMHPFSTAIYRHGILLELHPCTACLTRPRLTTVMCRLGTPAASPRCRRGCLVMHHFNVDLSAWSTGSVVSMYGSFDSASSFNGSGGIPVALPRWHGCLVMHLPSMGIYLHETLVSLQPCTACLCLPHRSMVICRHGILAELPLCLGCSVMPLLSMAVY
jgi:hypothetical protein